MDRKLCRIAHDEYGNIVGRYYYNYDYDCYDVEYKGKLVSRYIYLDNAIQCMARYNELGIN